MLQFCYGINYDDTGFGPKYRPHVNVGVYEIADKYQIPGLKEVAAMKYKSALLEEYEGKRTLQWEPFKFLVSQVYSGPFDEDSAMRTRLVAFCRSWWALIRHEPGMVEIADAFPEFILEVASREELFLLTYRKYIDRLRQHLKET